MRASKAIIGFSAVVLALAGCTSSDGDPGSSPAVTTGGGGATATAVPAVVRLIDRGIQQAEDGEDSAALESFRRALELDPGNRYAWYNMGLIFHRDGDLERAIDHYERALQTDPEYFPALFNKAIALESSEPEQSVDIYRQIIAIDDTASTAHLRLGLLLAKQGDDGTAASSLARAVELDPNLREQIPATLRPASSSPARTTTS